MFVFVTVTTELKIIKTEIKNFFWGLRLVIFRYAWWFLKTLFMYIKKIYLDIEIILNWDIIFLFFISVLKVNTFPLNIMNALPPQPPFPPPPPLLCHTWIYISSSSFVCFRGGGGGGAVAGGHSLYWVEKY